MGERAYFRVPHDLSERLFMRGHGSSEAFEWLCRNAVTRDRTVNIGRGKRVDLRRGELCHSLRHLAREWRRSVGWVQRFITTIQQWNEIRCTTDSGQTRITICFFTEKPACANLADSPTDSDPDTEAGTKRKNGRTEEPSASKDASGGETRAREGAIILPRESQIDLEFGLFWRQVEHRVHEDEARRQYRIARRAGANAAEIVEGWRRYASNKPPDQQWLHPSNFLKHRRWRDQPASLSAGQGPIIDGNTPPRSAARTSPSRSTFAAAFNQISDHIRASNLDISGLQRGRGG